MPEVVPHGNVDENAGSKDSVDTNNERFFVPGSNAVVDEHAMMVEFLNALVTDVAVRGKRFSHYKACAAFSVLIDCGGILLLNFFVFVFAGLL